MDAPTASAPSIPPNKALLPEQDIAKVSIRRQSTESSKTLKPSQTRELSTSNHILHKENERKEHRIQALTKEIQNLRVSHSNDQRELKLMANSIDLLKKEKVQLETERKQTQVRLQQLQHQLDQHSSSQSKLVVEANERLSKEVAGLGLTVSSLQGELLLKKEEIGRLKEELQVAALTIETQNNYENAIFYDSQQATSSSSLPVKTNLSLSFGKNREILKQLYFDLSKKTVNNQSLSEELATVARDSLTLRNSLTQVQTQLATSRQETATALAQNDELRRRLEQSEKECGVLSQRLSEEVEAVAQRDRQLSDATRRSTEYRIQTEQARHEINYEINELKEKLRETEMTAASLNVTITSLKEEQRQTEQRHLLAMRDWEEEKDLLLQHQDLLAEQVKALQEVQRKCEEVQGVLTQRETECQRLSRQCEALEQEKHELKAKVSYISFYLQREKDTTSQLTSKTEHLQAALQAQTAEKEEVLQAFQQLLRTSKDLAATHQEARKEVEALQQRVKEVETVKENMHSAILGALFDERMKSMISRQIDADSMLQHQLQPPQPPQQYQPPQGVLVGYGTLHTTSPSASEVVEKVVDRIARGDFDWLNDDSVIHSVLHESLNQSQAIQRQLPLQSALPREIQQAMMSAPPNTATSNTLQYQNTPSQPIPPLPMSIPTTLSQAPAPAPAAKSLILEELEKFQQHISQLHATPHHAPTSSSSSSSSHSPVPHPTHATSNNLSSNPPLPNNPTNGPVQRGGGGGGVISNLLDITLASEQSLYSHDNNHSLHSSPRQPPTTTYTSNNPSSNINSSQHFTHPSLNPNNPTTFHQTANPTNHILTQVKTNATPNSSRSSTSSRSSHSEGETDQLSQLQMLQRTTAPDYAPARAPARAPAPAHPHSRSSSVSEGESSSTGSWNISYLSNSNHHS